MPGRIQLGRGPSENGNRPAVDPMFRTAALSYGPGVVGVVRTGNLDDGTAGLRTIKRRGGIAVAQNPEDALFPSMPASAIEHVAVDHVVKLSELPALLEQLVTAPLPEQENNLEDALWTALRALEAAAEAALSTSVGKPASQGADHQPGVARDRAAAQRLIRGFATGGAGETRAKFICAYAWLAPSAAPHAGARIRPGSRGSARLSEAEPRVRLYRLQARESRPSHSQTHAVRRRP